MPDSIPEATPFLRLGGREWQWPVAIRALRHHNYRLFWGGQLISLIGTWMQRTAQQWLVYRLTGSSLRLGQITFISFLPVLLLSPIAGVLVDRVDKRKLLLVTQSFFLLQAAALAALTATDQIQFWQIAVLAFCLGIGEAFDMTARQSFVIEMTGRDDLMNAIALNSSVFNGARIIGPAVAGLLVAQVGEAWAFGFNALSYVAVIIALAAMRLGPGRAAGGADGNALQQLRAGLSYTFRHPAIRGLIGMVAVFSFFGMYYVTLIPIYAGQIFRIGPRGLGWMLSAVGTGALIGALSLAALGNFPRKGRLVTVGALAFAAALLVLSFSTSLPLSLLALAVGGWAQITQLAASNTLIQTIVPDDLRGRVMSTYTWMLGGMFPLGALLAGAVAQRWGAPLTIRMGALVCGLFAALVVWRFPAVRSLE